MKYVIHTSQDTTGIAPADAQWMATFGEYDLGAPIGTGATEADAISDLVLNHELEAAVSVTNEELQNAIKTLALAKASGLVEESHDGGETWTPFDGHWMINDDSWLHRIKPQPREVFIAIEDIPGPGCGHPNAYVLDAGELSQLANPQKFRKFREVI